MNNNLQHFDEILDNLSDGIIIMDNAGIVLFCNLIAAQNYGISKSKLVGNTHSFLTENGFVDQSFSHLVLSTRKPVTYEQTCKSGKRLINKTIPVFNQKKQLTHIIEQSYCVKELVFDSTAPQSETPILKQMTAPPAQISSPQPFAQFKSKAMEQVYKMADNMATKNINMLILGDSGTGKSCLAKRLHDNSTRKNGPFITINCSTIPENLLESELFGYLKGAFSGADHNGKLGLVDMSDQGTLFLDEIGELPLGIQSKLLQLVQDKTYLPIGGIHPKQVDTRIIAATNKDLTAQVNAGRFREDLYYRLAVVTITMPSLRSRPEDVSALITHFTSIFNVKHDTDVRLSRDTIELLCRYSWPGNIRELEHLMEFLILNASEEYVTPFMLPANIMNGDEIAQVLPADEGLSVEKSDFSNVTSLDSFLEQSESQLICALYSQLNSSYKLADRLKISQSKAMRLIRKYVK